MRAAHDLRVQRRILTDAHPHVMGSQPRAQAELAGIFPANNRRSGSGEVLELFDSWSGATNRHRFVPVVPTTEELEDPAKREVPVHSSECPMPLRSSD